MKKFYICIAIVSMLFLNSARVFPGIYDFYLVSSCESVEEAEADVKEALSAADQNSDFTRLFYAAKDFILPSMSKNFVCRTTVACEFPSHTVLFFSKAFNHSPPTSLA